MTLNHPKLLAAAYLAVGLLLCPIYLIWAETFDWYAAAAIVAWPLVAVLMLAASFQGATVLVLVVLMIGCLLKQWYAAAVVLGELAIIGFIFG